MLAYRSRSVRPSSTPLGLEDRGRPPRELIERVEVEIIEQARLLNPRGPSGDWRVEGQADNKPSICIAERLFRLPSELDEKRKEGSFIRRKG